MKEKVEIALRGDPHFFVESFSDAALRLAEKEQLPSLVDL